MKRIITTILLLGWAAVGIFADPCEGYWLSIDDKSGKITAGWEIYTSGGKLYGRILSIAGWPQDARAERCKETYRGFPVSGNVREMTVVGTPWIFGLSPEKTGRWSGGNVIDPENGNLYACKIIYHDEAAGKGKEPGPTLEMRGEIGLGIGRSQFWRKATAEEAASVR